MAVVDAQERNVPRGGDPCAGQKSSVAAQREDEVGVVQEVGGRLRFRVGFQLDGLDLPCPHRMKHGVDLVLLDT